MTLSFRTELVTQTDLRRARETAMEWEMVLVSESVLASLSAKRREMESALVSRLHSAKHLVTEWALLTE